MFYQYECEKCGLHFEEWQQMRDEHKADCPQCGAAARREYHVPQFRIDWVNGGYHGDDINLGLGRHFKSSAERDYFAAEHNLVKSPEL